MKIMKLLLFCGLTACFMAHNETDYSEMQLQQALVTAQQALNAYQRNAPQQDYALLLEFLHYYRSWYQAVTPAPMALIEQLSPAALKLVAQLKAIARNFTRLRLSGPSGSASYDGQAPAPRQMPGASRLTPAGEEFYKKVIAMAEAQLIDGKLASLMILPRLQSRLA